MTRSTVMAAVFRKGSAIGLKSNRQLDENSSTSYRHSDEKSEEKFDGRHQPIPVRPPPAGQPHGPRPASPQRRSGPRRRRAGVLVPAADGGAQRGADRRP